MAFINLVQDYIIKRIKIEGKRDRKIPAKFLEKDWITITDPNEFREIFSHPLHFYLEDFEDFFVAVHVSHPAFAKNEKYIKFKKMIIDNYEDEWYKIAYKEDFKGSDLEKMTIYEVIYLVKKHIKENVIVDLETMEIDFTPLISKSLKELEAMSRDQLREECRALGLSMAGKKEELLERLKQLIK